VKKIIFFICVFCFQYLVYSQNSGTESFRNVYSPAPADTIKNIQKLISTHTEDTNKVMLLLRLSNIYMWSYPDSALLYSKRGLQLSQKLNFQKGEILILHSIGEALSTKGNYTKALETQLKALQLAEESGDHLRISESFVWLGNVYYYSGDFQKALSYYYKAKLNKEMFEQNQELIFVLVGESYSNLNRLDSALFYIQKACDLDLQEKTHMSDPYFQLAAINVKLGRTAKALAYYRMGINVSINKTDTIGYYIGIASIYKKTGLEDSAIYYSKKAVGEALNASFPSNVIDASRLLAEIYKSRSIYDSAFKYQEIMLAAKDSLFSQEKVKQIQNLSFDEQSRQQEIEAAKLEFKNQVKVFALLAALVIFFLIAFFLWRNNLHKQKINVLLKQQKEKVESTLQELKSTQAQLIQSEKMASLGELTAGIAHEIQNPLNFVNNFSEVNREMLVELNDEIEKGNYDDAKSIAKDVIANEEKINHHGKRADSIVKGMLEHSRTSTGIKQPTDINKLCDEYLRLSYHGLRAKEKSFNADFKTDFDETIDKINIVSQDIGRVLLNLYNNAFYATNEKKKTADENYNPLVSIQTKKINDKIEISVSDNGNGIPKNIIDKIFQPFFTTKPTGQGTGLGLSLSYDIITKEHNGTIKVNSKEGEGTEFIIQLLLVK
jgi:two-component system, NtrC family, sensor kinase